MLTTKDIEKIVKIVNDSEARLSGRMDSRFDRIEAEIERIRDKITDVETFQYGLRATGKSNYQPEPEPLMAPGAAAIEPVQAWRRKI